MCTIYCPMKTVLLGGTSSFSTFGIKFGITFWSHLCSYACLTCSVGVPPGLLAEEWLPSALRLWYL